MRAYLCPRIMSSMQKKGNNRNFGGMADMSDWFIMKDPVEHRQKALEW